MGRKRKSSGSGSSSNEKIAKIEVMSERSTSEIFHFASAPPHQKKSKPLPPRTKIRRSASSEIDFPSRFGNRSITRPPSSQSPCSSAGIQIASLRTDMTVGMKTTMIQSIPNQKYPAQTINSSNLSKGQRKRRNKQMRKIANASVVAAPVITGPVVNPKKKSSKPKKKNKKVAVPQLSVGSKQQNSSRSKNAHLLLSLKEEIRSMVQETEQNIKKHFDIALDRNRSQLREEMKRELYKIRVRTEIGFSGIMALQHQNLAMLKRLEESQRETICDERSTTSSLEEGECVSDVESAEPCRPLPCRK